jgi:hypothetical protein
VHPVAEYVISDFHYKITLFESPKRRTIPRLLTNTELTHGRRPYTHIALDSYYIVAFLLQHYSVLQIFTFFNIIIVYVNEFNINSKILNMGSYIR